MQTPNNYLCSQQLCAMDTRTNSRHDTHQQAFSPTKGSGADGPVSIRTYFWSSAWSALVRLQRPRALLTIRRLFFAWYCPTPEDDTCLKNFPRQSPPNAALFCCEDLVFSFLPASFGLRYVWDWYPMKVAIWSVLPVVQNGTFSLRIGPAKRSRVFRTRGAALCNLQWQVLPVVVLKITADQQCFGVKLAKCEKKKCGLCAPHTV